ncbi:hypothetical protein [Actinokineospora inagensis]|uniref:hypothetical protein n=1 Tax=Actinokineospora inagensis TaxID=103730 RepID=UPI00047D97C3|nr:hypothetical protein [Actinokineospora inagensis]
MLPLMGVSARAAAPRALSADVLAAMTPEQQGVVLEPLRLAADAVARVGQGARSDIYTQVEMAADYRSINVYLTDVRQGRDFVAAVGRLDPKVDLRLINVVAGKRTWRQVRQEITDLGRADLPFKVISAGSSVDGGVISLAVDDPDAARAHFAGFAAGEVRVGKAPSTRLLTRWNDSAPFYAGAALGPASGGQSYCTSGIPAVSTWDGRQWLVTAAHCYNVGDNVYTAGGSLIGQVKYERPAIDSAFIEARTNRYTWDGVDATGYTRYLNGVRNIAVGDFTCQLGYNSKVVCNIRTTQAGTAGWSANGTTVLGSWGVPNGGGVVGRGGDSGGPVITINDPNSRQLNGIISVGSGCDANKVCSSGLGWVDVWSIFNDFAIKLNPS